MATVWWFNFFIYCLLLDWSFLDIVLNLLFYWAIYKGSLGETIWRFDSLGVLKNPWLELLRNRYRRYLLRQHYQWMWLRGFIFGICSIWKHPLLYYWLIRIIIFLAIYFTHKYIIKYVDYTTWRQTDDYFLITLHLWLLNWS
jgi:hypothetical protein